MSHSDDPAFRRENEGAAVRIGPLSPGESEDEFHVYFEPGQHARSLFITRDMEAEPRRLTVRLILENAAPYKSVLASLRLLEMDSNGNETARGFRLVLIPGISGDAPLTLEAPPVQFLLPRESDQHQRHYVLRINVKYAEE